MEYGTPQAIRQIKSSSKINIVVDGKEQCKLQAMSYAFKYHTIDVTESPFGLLVRGTQAISTGVRF